METKYTPFFMQQVHNDGEETEDELLNFIHRIDSTQILYRQPEIKYRLIGPYIKGDVLGEGSYGKVKECIHSRTLQRCALKIMHYRTLRRIPNGEQNAQREIKMLRNLRHKNVIRLLDVMHFTDKQKVYMVMEYCVTGLQDLLESSENRKIPVWQAHRYFTQLMEGLEYLHSKGIIHKDIKPGNLLLTTNSILKIIDFGVAEELNPLAENDMITTSQGSPTFQPPEVAGGADRFPGFKVDIWSSGITLYNIISGEYPFMGSNVFRLYESICEDPITIPEELEESLRDLLTGMLIKDPYKRLGLQDIKKTEWFMRKQTSAEDAVALTVSRRNKYATIDAIRGHYYDDGDEIPASQHYITEHELNESRNKEDQLSVELSKNNCKVGIVSKPKKKKPLSCINIKGLSSCSQS